MKLEYIKPQMKAEKATPVCILASSENASTEDVFAVATENGWPIQLCPFTNQRCCDKQEHFNSYCQVVANYAQYHIDYLFHTERNMFDNCPHHYTSLCAQHEQKQRG